MQWIRQHLNILLILITGAVLRFWNYSRLPYCHDEISALLRTRFTTLGELIQQGVAPDGHPAGTQLLLWFWTKVFGYGTMVVKLPFELAGVWSVWLIYIIGKRVKGEQTALVAAALMATLQFPITFSQWARPYSLGLAAVLVFFWSVMAISQIHDNRKWKYLLIAAISASACGYLHYFALLQAIFIGLFALPLLKFRGRLMLLFSAVLGTILWLPHLNLTLGHLHLGGIGDWLQPPKSDFWWQMIKYTFGYSWWALALIAMASLSSFLNIKSITSYKPWMLVLLCVSPFALGYYYSITVNPLLHQSVLLFAMPFLLLLLSYFIDIKTGMQRIFLIILLALNIGTLVDDRQHFYINYHHEFNGMLDWMTELESNGTSFSNIIDLREDGVRFLFEKNIIPKSKVFLFSQLKDSNNAEVYLNQLGADRLLVGINAGTDPELYAAALRHYPCIIESRYFHTSEAHLLGKECDSRIFQDEVNGLLLTSADPYSDAEILTDEVLSDSFNTHYLVKWHGSVSSEASSVIECSDSTVKFWEGSSTNDFIDSASKEQFAYHVIYNSEIKEQCHDQPLKHYLWLIKGDSIWIDQIQRYTVPSNVLKYKLFRE